MFPPEPESPGNETQSNETRTNESALDATLGYVTPPNAIAPGKAAAVLAIGPAVGVLVATAHAGRAERDEAVQSHLRALTGWGDISIERRPSGRPGLAPPYPELGISLSRREGLVLAGFSPDARVGVDLEPNSLGLDPLALSRDHFAPAEARIIANLAASSVSAARDAFLRLWVAKEAALKITGRGIYDGLGEPDCAGIFNTLLCGGAIAALPASARLPALRLYVRTHHANERLIYCALAVEGE